MASLAHGNIVSIGGVVVVLCDVTECETDEQASRIERDAVAATLASKGYRLQSATFPQD